MKYISTGSAPGTPGITAVEAVCRGLAEDGGLYLPETLPQMDQTFIDQLPQLSFTGIARKISEELLGSEIEPAKQHKALAAAFNFEVPLVAVGESIYVLELFHGPTLAFKDFGARFMAHVFAEALTAGGGTATVLTATSGDTGGAVAGGFLGVPGIRVVVLYPGGKISPLQRQQIAALGGNITALEVEGNFDDCQRLAKAAFSDQDLSRRHRLCSANSINIARLIPQSFYYFQGVAELRRITGANLAPVFCVPSGNFGNLSAGIIASRMGLPHTHFLAATNANDVVPEWLRTKRYEPRPSQETLSTAMDIGAPSNVARLLALYGQNLTRLSKEITAISVTDDETRSTISEVYRQYGYVLDPHTAVGYAAAARHLEKSTSAPVIVLATAHPVKFREIVEPLIGRQLDMPQAVVELMQRKAVAQKIKPELDALAAAL